MTEPPPARDRRRPRSGDNRGGMELFLIDAIGPFFRAYRKKRVNWSKIPFADLAEADDARWDRIAGDLRRFAAAVKAQGYNAVTLDDLAHLAPHPLHEPEIAALVGGFRQRFRPLFDLLRDEFDLRVFLTSDVLPVTPAVEAALGGDKERFQDYYRSLVAGVLDDFPQLDGLILRIGESDGHDVDDPIRTRLHLTRADETRQLLRALLPEFESRGRRLILRTWTVGAHPIGDLIWHRRTLARTLDGIDSPAFVVSMKYGESDFFRYLPLNRAFLQLPHAKIIELQARREYEGAGEFPSFIGPDCERFARGLRAADNMLGLSVWCQTGGWHRFRRLAFLEDGGRDVWIRLNTAVAIGVFRDGLEGAEILRRFPGIRDAGALVELMDLAGAAVLRLWYLPEFAGQKLFFRRVRIPPLLHVYWDSIFINHGVRKGISHFIRDPQRAIDDGEEVMASFPRMLELAAKAGLPVDDIEHMRDVFGLVQLARRYYFEPFSPERVDRIKEAKKAYKLRWPAELRQRFRIKVSFDRFPLGRRTIALAVRLVIRRRRGYRWFDHLFTLGLLGRIYRIYRSRSPRSLPKFARKSAMGVDALFR